MTRILSYNILVGGQTTKNRLATTRAPEIIQMIRAANPDVVGLAEASNEAVVQEIATALEMEYVMSASPRHPYDMQVAVLSRLPIIATETHWQPPVLVKHSLEVQIREANGQPLTIFMTHLSAAFNQGRGGGSVRKREVIELLKRMSTYTGQPHLIMGDFNEMAPGEPFQASNLLKYVLQRDEHYQNDPKAVAGHPYIDVVVPSLLRPFIPMMKIVPRSKALCQIFDAAASLYAPRYNIGRLIQAGYIDSFRALHPYDRGFSCPAEIPSGRIDYIFANPTLATRLEHCELLVKGVNEVFAAEASDHLAIYADFA